MQERNPSLLDGIDVCPVHPTKSHRLIPHSQTKLPPKSYFPSRIAALKQELEYLIKLEKLWEMPTQPVDLSTYGK